MASDRYDENSVDDMIVGADLHELHPVPVLIGDVVSTREISSRGAGLKSYSLSTTVPQKICGHDPRRRLIQLNAIDFTGSSHGVRIGHSANEATSPQAYLLAVFQVGGTTATSNPLPLHATDELWAVADTAACTLSVAIENWV